MLFFTSICHSTTLECLQLVKKRELGNYCSLECHRMTKARFWLLCWVTVLVWQHPLRFFSRSFERAANVSSSWEVLTFQIYSIQSRCGVIWDPFSSDLGSICDTICLQTRVSLDPKTQCGWQSTEKKAERISFTHKNTTTTTSTTIYFLEVCIIRTVATLQKNIKTCFCLRESIW